MINSSTEKIKQFINQFQDCKIIEIKYKIMKIFIFKIQIMTILIFKHHLQRIKNKMKILIRLDQIEILVLKLHFLTKIINLSIMNCLIIKETLRLQWEVDNKNF